MGDIGASYDAGPSSKVSVWLDLEGTFDRIEISSKTKKYEPGQQLSGSEEVVTPGLTPTFRKKKNKKKKRGGQISKNGVVEPS